MAAISPSLTRLSLGGESFGRWTPEQGLAGSQCHSFTARVKTLTIKFMSRATDAGLTDTSRRSRHAAISGAAMLASETEAIGSRINARIRAVSFRTPRFVGVTSRRYRARIPRTVRMQGPVAGGGEGSEGTARERKGNNRGVGGV